jgi:hypothetical protein
LEVGGGGYYCSVSGWDSEGYTRVQLYARGGGGGGGGGGRWWTRCHARFCWAARFTLRAPPRGCLLKKNKDSSLSRSLGIFHPPPPCSSKVSLTRAASISPLSADGVRGRPVRAEQAVPERGQRRRCVRKTAKHKKTNTSLYCAPHLLSKRIKTLPSLTPSPAPPPHVSPPLHPTQRTNPPTHPRTHARPTHAILPLLLLLLLLLLLTQPVTLQICGWS